MVNFLPRPRVPRASGSRLGNGFLTLLYIIEYSTIWNGFPRIFVSAPKEFANENRDFHLHSSALSFHNIARSSIHDFVQSLACRTAARFEQRRRAARGHAQAFVSGRSLVGARHHRSWTGRSAS